MRNNYRFIFEEKFSLINSEAHIRQYIYNRNIFGSTHNYIFHYSRNGLARELHRNIDNENWYRLGQKLLNKRFFLSLLKQGKLLRSDFANFISQLNRQDLRNVSDIELIRLFTRTYELFSRFRGYFKTSRPEFQNAAELKLKYLLSKKFKDRNNIQQYFEILASPQDYDEINQELVDWHKLVSKKHDSRKLPSLIIRHLSRYPWLVGQSYEAKKIVVFFTKKYLTERKNLVQLTKEIQKLSQNKNKLRIKQRLLLKRLKSREARYLSQLFQQSALERMRLKGGWWGANFLFSSIYNEISKRTRIPLKELYSSYRINEVVRAIRNHSSVVNSDELKRRNFAYILWLKNRRLLFFSGGKAEKIINTQLNHMHNKQNSNEFTGKIASSGFAVGTVRIVMPGDLEMLKQAIDKVKKGDIMVTSMTQPNMVQLMRKVSAIITDEGGMISHAAIMSREFKIPCIVGTEIATKVFKDGDLVEVDANKGVVRLLKKAK